jgi:hypothetical protein
MKKILAVLIGISAIVLQGVEYSPLSNVKSGYADTQEAAISTAPIANFGAASQAAFPWKNRIVGVDLGEKRDFQKVEIELSKIVPARKEKDAGLGAVELFESSDNKTFTRIDKFTFDEKPLVRDGKDYCIISIIGNFSSRYLKIYLTQTRPFYVFGMEKISEGIQVLAEKKISLVTFSVPLVAGGKIPVALAVKDFPINGSLKITVLPENKVLWEKSLSQIKANQEIQVDLDVAKLDAGLKQLQLHYSDGKKSPAIEVSSRNCYMIKNNPLFLTPKASSDYTPKEVLIRDQKKQLLASNKPSAELEYTMPSDGGYYAIYPTLMDTNSQFELISGNGKSTPVKLDTWYSEDKNKCFAGETFALLDKFEPAQKIILRSKKAEDKIIALRVQKLSDAEVAVATAKDEMIPSVITHSDGYSNFYIGKLKTPAEFVQLIDTASLGNLYEFDWCVGVSSSVNYPSKVASNFWYKKNYYRAGDKVAGETIDKLIAEGNDPVKLVMGECKKRNLKLSLTFRADAFYPSPSSGMNGKFYDDNPQLRQKNTEGVPSIGLSYAYPETTAYFMSILKEMIAYKPNAIVIEFLRHPPFFGYDAPLIAMYTERHGKCDKSDFMNDKWQQLQCEIMTGFIKELRNQIDQVDPQMKLRVSFDEQSYYQQGLDVATWIKNGWIDMISPGIYNVGYEKYFPISPFVQMVKASPRTCLIFPRIECTVMGSDPTPAEEQGLIKIERKNLSNNMLKKLMIDFLHDGAQGIRPFNGGNHVVAQAIADRSGLQRWAAFEMPFLDIRAMGVENNDK